MSDDLQPTRHGSCHFCGLATSVATLVMLGARCDPCYVAYCREKRPTPTVPEKAIPVAKDHPRAWAFRLQWREKQGQALSEIQKSAWRTALRNIPMFEDEAA